MSPPTIFPPFSLSPSDRAAFWDKLQSRLEALELTLQEPNLSSDEHRRVITVTDEVLIEIEDMIFQGLPRFLTVADAMDRICGCHLIAATALSGLGLADQARHDADTALHIYTDAHKVSRSQAARELAEFSPALFATPAVTDGLVESVPTPVSKTTLRLSNRSLEQLAQRSELVDAVCSQAERLQRLTPEPGIVQIGGLPRERQRIGNTIRRVQGESDMAKNFKFHALKPRRA